ncbi:MAG TPA: prepilin-type N-terminal cleavage/methylation domain-containing protein [Candidatus Paceibacterota bacterium]|nr:prepilin-type N-terminal cleavage/methylation domain-containing protein [Candidatus Paceibacterota bacterium]
MNMKEVIRYESEEARNRRAAYDASRTAGFTLVETMVAIAILTVAIAGPLLTAERAAAAAYAAKNELIASYLAQEGIEYVRAMRDDTYLADYASESTEPGLSELAWSDFLSSNANTSIKQCAANGKGCAYDPEGVGMCTGNLLNCSMIACSKKYCTDYPLYLTAGGFYTPQGTSIGAALTPFSRQITFRAADPQSEEVVSTVAWSTDGVPYTVTVTDTLTPWQ